MTTSNVGGTSGGRRKKRNCGSARREDSAHDGITEEERGDHRGREGPAGRPAAVSDATHGGPHPTEVDVIARDQALLGIHATT
ncbi:hypothetical protein STXM2123_703 [Streptomyces sp. F-3]|nr:hypothetical protein STXM2123_703 [Streptomyces sp. F-3]